MIKLNLKIELETLLLKYEEIEGVDTYASIRDMLTDLEHISLKNDFNFSEIIKSAHSVYVERTAKTKEMLLEQLNMVKEIVQKADINIVTCGDCGAVLLHRTDTESDVIVCPHCNYTSDPCDFPDLLY
jgi:hypothetical protein